jgi:hypothetical protein
LSREVAERRAVQEFGAIGEIAPEYQTELALAQARRTALLVLFVLVTQPLVWRLWRSLPYPASDPVGQSFAVADDAIEWLGGLAMAGAFLAVFACGWGVRYLGARRRVAHVTGVFALAVSALFVVIGVGLAVIGPSGEMPLTWVRLPWALTVLVLPMVGVALSARRCVAATV